MNRFLAFIAVVFIILPLGIYLGASVLPSLSTAMLSPATSQSNPSGATAVTPPVEGVDVAAETKNAADTQAEEEEKSYFLSFVEDQLSSPNRKISISGIAGALSSQAQVGSITVADREGVWLRIRDAQLVWSRLALLRGNLSIDQLTAKQIDVIRKPLPDDSLPSPEAGGFALPELPLAILLGDLDVEKLSFGESVFGLASDVRLKGRLSLQDGSLDSLFDVTRLDGPGGSLKLKAAYANADQKLDLDLKLSEPANGIIANLLNIEGHPPVEMQLAGVGVLDDLKLNLNLDAASKRILTGILTLNRNKDSAVAGRLFNADISGPLASLMPEKFRDFFGSTSSLLAQGQIKDAGGFRLDNFSLNNAALQVKAIAESAADGFLTRLKVDALISDQEKGRVILPVSGGTTSLSSAKLNIDYGDRNSNDWTGSVQVEDLQAGELSAANVVIDLGGIAQNLQVATSRHVSFKADGKISGIRAQKPEIAEALGQQIVLDILGDWRAGSPVQLERAQLTGNGLSASLKGAIDQFIYTGDIALSVASLVPFSAVAGRELAGQIDLKANGTLEALTGGFDLDLDGSANQVKTGIDIADRIIAGESSLSGGLARNSNGFAARNFRVGNASNAITANGAFASKSADFDFAVQLGDLADLTRQAAGPLVLKGSARGSEGLIALATRANIATGSLSGRKLNDAVLDFNGVLDATRAQASALSGTINGGGFLGGERLALSAKLMLDETTKQINALTFTAGGTKLTGDLALDDAGLISGKLLADAPDVSTAAALFLVKASGALKADIDLSHQAGQQNATVKADIRNLIAEGNQIAQANIDAKISDLLQVPVVDGAVQAKTIKAGDLEIDTLDATAKSAGSKTTFHAQTALKIGTKAVVDGALEPKDGGFLLSLAGLDLRQGAMVARLSQPTSLAIKGSDVSIDAMMLQIGDGRLSLNGTLAEQYNLDVNVDNLPLSVANSVQPQLGLGGIINGKAKISGSRAKPDVVFDLNARDVIANEMRKLGIGAINASAKGKSDQNRLTVDSQITGGNGLDARATGSVPLGSSKAAGALDVNVDLKHFPLMLLNGIVKDQNLNGIVTGNAKITGAINNPAAKFDLSGSGLSAKPLAENGLAPLQLKASGQYGDKAVTLSALNLEGPQNLSVSAHGRVPLNGAGLGVDVTGQIPLALANRFLSDRGAQASGTLALTANVSGGFDNPQIRGMFSTSNGQMIDPETNIRLNNININGSMDGQTIRLRSMTAALSTGGSISADGTVSINAAQNFPADLKINFDQARYADGSMVVATIDGGLTITGPLMRDPLIAGRIQIERAEITVPDSLGGGGADIEVRHVNTPAAVLMTLQRAKVETREKGSAPVPSSRPTVPQLDVRVVAPNQIFVRGRGLDTELGGAVRLTGPITNIKPVGSFDLIRGRLDILTQRVTFDEGRVTLIGDMNPQLYFVARSDGGDITVLVKVQGTVDNLDIGFSSEPELPQDEVLARLIFNRSIAELSPFQIAQLAAAAAELAGGKNANLLGSLRQGIGLDDLDVVTDSQGNAAVRAGSYIRDNIYLGVEASGTGGTKGTINLDITRNLKAKGAVGSEGDSALGVFYEKTID